MRKPRTDRTLQRNEIAGFCKQVLFSQKTVELCSTEASAAQEYFVHRVFSHELENRKASRKRRRLKEAAFPVYKTLEGYQPAALKLPSTVTFESLGRGTFIGEQKNLVLYGPVGTGKTHFAIGLGIKACEADLCVRFFTAAELVVRLSEAFQSGTLERFHKSIVKAKLLIIDEWGYVPIDKQGAQLLFRIISDCYERRSIIITTNLEFSKWGVLFNDDQMAAAMIDRLAHHGHLILFEGESYRMKHALMREKS